MSELAEWRTKPLRRVTVPRPWYRRIRGIVYHKSGSAPPARARAVERATLCCPALASPEPAPAAARNIRLLLRHQTRIGTPRSLQGRALSAICRLIGRLIGGWGRLMRAWWFQTDTEDAPRLNGSSQSWPKQQGSSNRFLPRAGRRGRRLYPRSLRRRTLAARNGSPAHALSSVSGRLRRSAGRGGFSVVGEQRAKFGPRGPHGPPETAVRVDLPPWRAAFPASYAAISTCRRLTFNARHTRSHS